MSGGDANKQRKEKESSKRALAANGLRVNSNPAPRAPSPIFQKRNCQRAHAFFPLLLGRGKGGIRNLVSLKGFGERMGGDQIQSELGLVGKFSFRGAVVALDSEIRQELVHRDKRFFFLLFLFTWDEWCVVKIRSAEKFGAPKLIFMGLARIPSHLKKCRFFLERRSEIWDTRGER